MALKTRQRLLFARGAAKDKLRYKLSRSFWWNLIVWGVVATLVALVLRVIILNEEDPHVGSAPAIRLVAVNMGQPVSDITTKPHLFGGKKKGSGLTVRKFHRNFRAGKYGHWPKNYHYSRSYKAAWIKSANRHLHNAAKARQYYYTMIHTTTCQAAMYTTLTCRMDFPSVRYNWLHPADNSTSRKWALRVGWCGAVAVTEYYTRGQATRTLGAVGGKALALCLPSYLIP